jgi:Tol biopolymer transport system component
MQAHRSLSILTAAVVLGSVSLSACTGGNSSAGRSTSASAQSAATTAASTLSGRIVFSLQPSFSDEGSAQLVTILADGSGYRELTPAGHFDNRPNLSPDGKTVVFGRGENGSCDPVGTCDIWSVGVAGGTPTQLTHCDPSRTCLGNDFPAWSPNGKLIVFTRDQLNERAADHQGIYLMRPDGTDLRRIPGFDGSVNGAAGEPVFSPDSSRIAFGQEIVADASRLMSINVDGTKLHVILPDGAVGAPDWSPDGGTIVFSQGTSGNIEVVRPDGSGHRPLTQEPTGLRAISPSWSPDGERIVFSETTAGGGCDLYTINATGGDRRALLHVHGCARGTDWGPAN